MATHRDVCCPCPSPCLLLLGPVRPECVLSLPVPLFVAVGAWLGAVVVFKTATGCRRRRVGPPCGARDSGGGGEQGGVTGGAGQVGRAARGRGCSGDRGRGQGCWTGALEQGARKGAGKC